MTANQLFRGVRWPHAASRIGFIGACLALTSACSGSIEETDVDIGHQEQGNTGVPQKAVPTASSSTPAPAAPARTPAAPAPAARVASTPAPGPASTPAETPAAPAELEEPAALEDVSFAADVYPIFTASCGPCHAGTSAAGGQSIGNTDKAKALDDAKRVKDGIVQTITTGRMPLGCGKPPGGGGSCVTAEDFDTIQAWIEGGTPP